VKSDDELGGLPELKQVWWDSWTSPCEGVVCSLRQGLSVRVLFPQECRKEVLFVLRISEVAID